MKSPAVAHQRLKTAEISSVSVEGDLVRIKSASGVEERSIVALPERFWGWLMEGRREMFQSLSGDRQPAHFAQHLPVMITLNEEGPFWANGCNKGIGHLPKPDRLGEWNGKLERTHEEANGKIWKKSFDQRLNLVRSLYSEANANANLDRRCLVGLEIFEGRSRRNLLRHPYLSLLFTGPSPEYVSFQLNCVVQAVDATDPRFQFAQRMRTLFEYDAFHITQPRFSVAYLLWVVDAIDKTPYRLADDKPERDETQMDWAPEALGRISGAPSMIRSKIMGEVEQYARRRGFDTVTADLLTEARKNLLGAFPADEAQPAPDAPPDRFDRFLVGADNSPLSVAAAQLAVRLAERFGARVTGCHVYAARLHENRFQQMEDGLPEAYQDEESLFYQREVHNELIEKGLGMISDSYLDVLERLASEKGLALEHANREGPNYRELAAQMTEGDCDIAFIGVRGLGVTPHAFPGGVCRRVAHAAQRDLWIVKNEAPNEGPILACVDGSERSFAAVRRAIALSTALERPLHLVSAYDPHFHDVAFRSIAGVLSEEAAQVFRFEEQEKLHEEIINDGLAKIYEDHLNVASAMVRKAGLAFESKLLTGKPYEAILDRAKEIEASLILIGKTGFHHDPQASMGSNAEALLHLSGCDLLLVCGRHRPEGSAATSQKIPWTSEATERLQRIPERVRPMAKMAIAKEAEAAGEKEITAKTVDRLTAKLHPPGN